ncbi:hypothetical protein DL769_006149 [Monosporascus sp. CRB-8-3]|nr:hypothetical protein DL769_006149 [Monosporascus sp. CRB-8-3]
MAIRTKLLIVSDTNGEDIPQVSSLRADVVIHCGDITQLSRIREFCDSLVLLRRIQSPLKLVIAGNHDFTMDLPTFRRSISNANELLETEEVRREYGDYGETRELFHFLEEGSHHFELQNGPMLTVYASPFTSSLGDCWGFQYRPVQHELLWRMSTW